MDSDKQRLNGSVVEFMALAGDGSQRQPDEAHCDSSADRDLPLLDQAGISRSVPSNVLGFTPGLE